MSMNRSVDNDVVDAICKFCVSGMTLNGLLMSLYIWILIIQSLVHRELSFIALPLSCREFMDILSVDNVLTETETSMNYILQHERKCFIWWMVDQCCGYACDHNMYSYNSWETSAFTEVFIFRHDRMNSSLSHCVNTWPIGTGNGSYLSGVATNW